MPKLGEVIGALLADAAQARVQADLEAVKIAEAYSRHELLKHLPVPRFRLPEITVDLPVLVSAVEGLDSGGARIFGEPTSAEITKAVREGSRGSNIRLPREELTNASAAAVQRAKELFAASARLLGPARFAHELTDVVVASVKAALGDDADPEQLKALDTAMQSSLRDLLATKLVPSPDVQVLATAGEIKAHADIGSVVRIRLTITEDAYEVVTRDDGLGYYLTPE
jgi:hypothetical protein